jgi:alpha,alpha-trehalase
VSDEEAPGQARGSRAVADRGPWSLYYAGFDPAQERLREALCTTGNGHFATRGAAPEAGAGAGHYPGTYAAGVFNRLTSQVAGRSVENEDLVNLPNWLPLTFRVGDGPWFAPADAEMLEYAQELDLRRGLLTRRLRFRDAEGRHTRVVQRRFVSMADRHLAALECTLHAEDWSGVVEIRSGLDGGVENAGVARYAELEGRHLEAVETAEIGPETLALTARTTQSGIAVAETARTRLCAHGARLEAERRLAREGGAIAHRISHRLEEGDSVTIEKTVALSTSRDPAISEPGEHTRRVVAHAGSFEELLRPHVIRWDHLWERAGLTLGDHERSTLILNLHVFHLLQTVSEASVDLDVGVPARGLHGEAYRGHIFWDELFIFPFLTMTLPELSRSLLRYRHRRLPAARRAAAEEGFAGAMFPWQSGSDGREETQTLHLNPRSGRWLPDRSHRQRHISSAVAYNVWWYHQATGDEDFLTTYGAEVLLEVARFWSSAAEYDHVRDRYVIRGVMGPDEYHDGYPDAQEGGVDNNAYTNVMAVWVLCRGLELLDRLPGSARRALQEQLGLGRAELDRWEDVSRRMFVPFHGADIISQFEGYEQLEELAWAGYRERYGDIHRLDRILEAEGDTTNRYKASKQADVLMLFYLLSQEELSDLLGRLGYTFGPEAIPGNVAYYEERTSHGSTLSRVVHGWVLARANRRGSWELFEQALESDVSDIQGGTTSEGIHLGAMAGTVDLAVRGYTGVDPRGDVLWLNPCLPEELDRLELSIRYRRHWNVVIAVSDGRLRVTVPPSAAPPIALGYEGEVIALGAGETFEAPLPARARPASGPATGYA